MLTTMHVPEARHLKQIVDATTFPATIRQIRRVAHQLGFAGHMPKFLRLFSDNEKFETGDDFLDQCHELMMAMGEEREY